jgi:hypothetical protein
MFILELKGDIIMTFRYKSIAVLSRLFGSKKSWQTNHHKMAKMAFIMEIHTVFQEIPRYNSFNMGAKHGAFGYSIWDVMGDTLLDSALPC